MMKTKTIALLYGLIALLLAGCLSRSGQASIQAEQYATVDYAVGNIAYGQNGDLIYSNHPFYNPEIRVMRYSAQSQTASPFPSAAWNTPAEDSQSYLSSVLGIRSDGKGVVWMLDMGFRNQITPKFVGWNTIRNELEGIIEVPPPASLSSSQLNDFVIDDTHGVFIIADEDIGPNGDGSRAALVVVDRQTGGSRRLLQGHFSTVPDPTKPLMFSGKPLNQPGTNKPILVGADSIVADQTNTWLYYAPLNGDTVYRIPIADLLDTALSPTQLGTKVERYAKKENNGGMSIDLDGNLYLTYLESHSIGIVTADGRKSYRYASHKDMVWPDGVSYAPDGYMYVGASQLQLAAVFNNGTDKTSTPFAIFRFRPVNKGIVGR